MTIWVLILYYWTSRAGGPVQVAEYYDERTCISDGMKATERESSLWGRDKAPSYFDCVKVHRQSKP